MKQAYAQDEDEISNGRPAVYKLQIIDRVEEMLMKTNMQTVALDSGILGVMKEWLKPLGDKSLPSLTIQRSLFRIMIAVRSFD